MVPLQVKNVCAGVPPDYPAPDSSPRLARVAESSAKMVPRASRILDVGCGRGYMPTSLREICGDALVFGTEISVDNVSEARRRGLPLKW